MITSKSKIVVRDMTKKELANLEIDSTQVMTSVEGHSISSKCNETSEVINVVYEACSSFHIQARRQVEVELEEVDGGDNWRFKAMKLPTKIKVTPTALLRALSKLSHLDVVALMQHLQAA